MAKQYTNVDDYCADRYAAQTEVLERKDKEIELLTIENDLLKKELTELKNTEKQTEQQ